MIEYAMLIALGFLLASIVAVLFAGPFWRRAVRLTRKRLDATMPMTLADIQADKDQLRAEYAVEIRRLEMAHEREKDNAARFLVDRNNLGDQTLKEFQNYQPPGTANRFTDTYIVQHLHSPRIDDDAKVVITTIQRLYAMLRGEGLDQIAGIGAPHGAGRRQHGHQA